MPTWQTPGTINHGGASSTPGAPASIAAGDLLVIPVGWSNSAMNIAQISSSDGSWNKSDGSVGGGGTWGDSTGPRGGCTFWKVATGGDSMPTINNGGTTPTTTTQCYRVSMDNAGYVWDLAFAGGEDTSSGTGFSVTTTTDPGATTNDIALVLIVGPQDTVSVSSGQNLNWPSAGSGATTGVTTGANTNGNDLRYVGQRRTITTGPSTGAPTFTATMSAAFTGLVRLVRVREIPGVTNYDGTAALAATDTVTSAGEVGKVTGATVSATDTLSSTGVVGKVATAALAASVAIAATGVVGTSGDATLSSTATISAAGSVGAAGLTATASIAATDTITTAGQVGKATGATLGATDAITSAGAVGKNGAASLSETAVLTAAGTVGKSAASTLAATDTISATGVTGTSSAASLAGSVAITAQGVVGKSAGASLAATGTVAAAGSVASGLLGNATLSATGAISASGTVASSRGATLAAVATLAAAGTVDSTDPGAQSGVVLSVRMGIPVAASRLVAPLLAAVITGPVAVATLDEGRARLTGIRP